MNLRLGRIGTIAGIVSAALFVVFPSALNWYDQVHKDGFVVTGMLLLIWSWLWLRGRPADRCGALVVAGSTLVAVLLIAFVRPYNLILLVSVMTVVLGLVFFSDIRRLVARRKHLVLYLLGLVVLGAGSILTRDLGQYGRSAEVIDWHWEDSGWLPQWIEGNLEVSARTGARFISSGIREGAGSMKDTDAKPNSALKVVTCAPRAIQIALCAPFPAQWLEKISLARPISVLETLIWYLAAPGILVADYRLWSTHIIMLLCFALSFLYIYGLAIPNVGTLYRIRYPYLFLFITLGIIGWPRVLDRWRPARDARRDAPDPDAGAATSSTTLSGTSRSAMFGAGALIAVLTGLTYLELFLREIILARWFGVGARVRELHLCRQHG